MFNVPKQNYLKDKTMNGSFQVGDIYYGMELLQ